MGAYLELAITIFFFSTFELVSKTTVGYIHPLQLNFLRFLFGGLILFPLAIPFFKRQRLTFKDFGRLLVLGILGVSISLSLLQYSITRISASTAAVLFCTNPLFVTFFAGPLLQEKSTKYHLGGLLAGLGGIILICLDGITTSSFDALGILLAVLSAITYAMYTVYSKVCLRSMPGSVINSISFVLGSLVLLPALAKLNLPLFTFPVKIMPQMLYLIIAATAVAYYFFLSALSKLPATIGSLVFLIKPALATFLAWLILKEPITLLQIAGIGLVTCSVLVIKQGAKQQKKRTE